MAVDPRLGRSSSHMTTTNLLLHGAPAHVEVAGRGDPPLLLIGGAVPPGWADGLIQELSPARRIISFDYRPPDGWAGAPEPRTQVALSRDALAVLDHLQIDLADVLGYSRGAVAAYAAAFHAPGRVRSLVLLAPIAPFADLLIGPSPALPDDPGSLTALLTRAAFSDAFIETHPQEAAAMTAAVMENHATVIRVSREEEEPVPEHPEISQPVLIITAGGDRLVDQAHSARLLGAVRQSQHILIEGGSHMVAFERPAAVAHAIGSFLTELGS